MPLEGRKLRKVTKMMTETTNTEWRAWPAPTTRTPVTPVTPEGPEETPLAISELGRNDQAVSGTPVTPDNFRNERSVEDILTVLLVRWLSVFRLPDIVNDDQPSLRRVIKYTWEGEWGPEGGPVRTLAKIDAILIVIPLVTLLYSLAWIIRRPTRRVIAVAFAAVIGWSMGWIG